jgi:hypothetical protein
MNQEQQLIVGSATDGFGDNANQPWPVDLDQQARVQRRFERERQDCKEYQAILRRTEQWRKQLQHCIGTFFRLWVIWRTSPEFTWKSLSKTYPQGPEPWSVILPRIRIHKELDPEEKNLEWLPLKVSKNPDGSLKSLYFKEVRYRIAHRNNAGAGKKYYPIIMHTTCPPHCPRCHNSFPGCGREPLKQLGKEDELERYMNILASKKKEIKMASKKKSASKVKYDYYFSKNVEKQELVKFRRESNPKEAEESREAYEKAKLELETLVKEYNYLWFDRPKTIGLSTQIRINPFYSYLV